MQDLLPGLNESILANLRQAIHDREVELDRHGCHNAASHKLHLEVALLSEIDNEDELCKYLRHLMKAEIERG